MLYKTIWNFINIVVRLKYYDYIGQVWNKSKYIYKMQIFKDGKIHKIYIACKNRWNTCKRRIY